MKAVRVTPEGSRIADPDDLRKMVVGMLRVPPETPEQRAAIAKLEAYQAFWKAAQQVALLRKIFEEYKTEDEDVWKEFDAAYARWDSLK